MKLLNLIRDWQVAASVMRMYGRQHYAAISSLEGLYVKQSDGGAVTGTDTTLTIKAGKVFYKITRTVYISNTKEYEDTWLASYGWYSPGYLLEIGGDRHCVLEAGSGILYLVTLTEKGRNIVEQFIKFDRK